MMGQVFRLLPEGVRLALKRQLSQIIFWAYKITGSSRLLGYLQPQRNIYFTPYADRKINKKTDGLQIFAFYYDQDLTSAASARPLFLKHQRPVLKDPAYSTHSFLGTIDIARNYGINGFVISSRTIAKHFLESAPSDFHFCLSLTNNNFSVEEIETIVSDPRYLRHHQRPTFLVKALEQTQIDTLKKDTQHLNPILILQSTHAAIPEITKSQFEAYIEMPSPKNKAKDDKVDFGLLQVNKHSLSIPLIAPHFDFTEPLSISFDETPALFERLLFEGILKIRKTEANIPRVIFLESWNNWEKRTQLEPDTKNGYAYLNAIPNALNAADNMLEEVANHLTPKKTADIAVILHLFYIDLAPEVANFLANIPVPYDLYVSLPWTLTKDEIEGVKKALPQAQFIIVKNQGRDILPFITVLRSISHLNYKYGLKIHSKKSLWKKSGDTWRSQLYASLLGNNEIVTDAMATLSHKHSLGLVASDAIMRRVGAETHFSRKKLSLFLKKYGISNRLAFSAKFPAGSMYWFRFSDMDWIQLPEFDSANFEEENHQIDGTLAHIAERWVGIWAAKKMDNLNE